jgi:hypothetical protein
MNNYVIEYEIVYPYTGNRSDRIKTVEPIKAESKYNAVALLAKAYGNTDRKTIDIFTVEEIN